MDPVGTGVGGTVVVIVVVLDAAVVVVVVMQRYDPNVLEHAADAEQTEGRVAHSLISLQLTPDPVNPAKQLHRNEPAVLMQAALTTQLCKAAAHSLRSTHDVPLAR